MGVAGRDYVLGALRRRCIFPARGQRLFVPGYTTGARVRGTAGAEFEAAGVRAAAGVGGGRWGCWDAGVVGASYVQDGAAGGDNIYEYERGVYGVCGCVY